MAFCESGYECNADEAADEAMSKGLPYIGMAEFSRRVKIGLAIFYIILAASFLTPIIWIISDTIKDNRLTVRAENSALFNVGDIVQSRIAKFRGIVIRRYCGPKGCDYLVRFDGASMQPYDMGEYELEVWRP